MTLPSRKPKPPKPLFRSRTTPRRGTGAVTKTPWGTSVPTPPVKRGNSAGATKTKWGTYVPTSPIKKVKSEQVIPTLTNNSKSKSAAARLRAIRGRIS